MLKLSLICLLGILTLGGSALARESVQSYEIVLRNVYVRSNHLDYSQKVKVQAQISLCIYENHQDVCTKQAWLQEWVGGKTRFVNRLDIAPNTIYSDSLRAQVDLVWVAEGMKTLFPNLSARNPGESVEQYFARLRHDSEGVADIARPFIKIELMSIASDHNTGETLGDIVYGLQGDLMAWSSAWTLRPRDLTRAGKDGVNYEFITELWAFGNIMESPVRSGRPSEGPQPICVEYQTMSVGDSPRFAVVDLFGIRRLGTFATAAEARKFIETAPSCKQGS